jgi:hypothetical protein
MQVRGACLGELMCSACMGKRSYSQQPPQYSGECRHRQCVMWVDLVNLTTCQHAAALGACANPTPGLHSRMIIGMLTMLPTYVIHSTYR